MNQFEDADKTVINAPAPEATQIVSRPQAAVTQMATTVECPVCKTPNASTETYCSDLNGSAFGYAVNSGRIAAESASSLALDCR
jgi:hypothetical protein